MTNKVMIIDDNETNLKLMNLILTKADFKTDTIINPKFAFDIIKEQKPAIILLDINMPEVNGFQLCKMLKKEPITKNIPIIFVSTFNDAKYIAGGLALGGVDYITKPIKPEELVARVSVQMQLAIENKKLRKTNDALQQQVTKENLEISDVEEDFLYSLIQIKLGKDTDKDYKRIKDFYNFITKKTIENSQYKDEFNDNFIEEVFKKVF